MCPHKDWPGPDDDWEEYDVNSGIYELHPPPPEPPPAQMVIEDKSGDIFVDGVRYVADWITKDVQITQRPVEPVP